MKLNILKNFKYQSFFKTSKFFSSYYNLVSRVQRPGDSHEKAVTVIPGEGIGKELFSICFKFIIK
jgi:hypothetical protein